MAESEERALMAKLYEQNMRLLVIERSGGVSEVTGRPVRIETPQEFFPKREPAWPRGVIHHILGRNKPKGFKGLPEVIREWWPHIPFLCIVLTAGEHEATIKYPRVLKVLLMNFMLLKHRHWVWEGKTVEEWLKKYFGEWL